MTADAFARALGDIQGTNSLPMLARLRGRLEGLHKQDPELKSVLAFLESKRQSLLETALLERGHALFGVNLEWRGRRLRAEWRLDSLPSRRTRQGGTWYLVLAAREAAIDAAPAFDGDEDPARWQRILEPYVQAVVDLRGW